MRGEGGGRREADVKDKWSSLKNGGAVEDGGSI